MTIRDQSGPDRTVPRRQPAAGQAAAPVRRSAGSADYPILASKIAAPHVPDWAVQRPRITTLIAQGVRWCPLTVLTGPPGAGKTIALALSVAAEPGTVAWVSLDEYDNRPEVFWPYVVAALRQVGVSVPKALSAAAQGQAGGHVFLLRLAAALAARDSPTTLVLDDLHLLTEPRVLKGLDFVLRNAGAGLRLAVASRMDPLLPMHRYRLAGQLAEIRARDLAFTAAEAGQLLAQHDITLSADALEHLMRRTEGWAAGLRLAAISLGAHPDPDPFVKELATEDSALTGYLVEEVLSAQPPQVREVLLCTSILEQVSADAAVELAGDERAAGTFTALARANAFIQPIGSGSYRYHTLFAEVLRVKLGHEYPDRVAGLHRGAARWHARNGKLADAVRHAARADDWPLAAATVIDDLAIGQILDPRSGQSLAGEFANMPYGRAWAEPQPYLVQAAVALSAGRPESSDGPLSAAEGVVDRLPPDQQATCRLAAVIIRLDASLCTGDMDAAAQAAAQAEILLGQVPSDKLARHPAIRVRVLSGRGAVALWAGHFDKAARALQAGIAARSGSVSQAGPADCVGKLALAEALRGRLRRAATLAAQVTAPTAGSQQTPGQDPEPAALVALAWVHLERYELREAGSRLKQADSALDADPDKLTGAVAYLVAACGALAEGRPAVVTQIIARARSGRPVPAWLDQQLSLIQSRACAAAGDVQAAIDAAERAGASTSPEVAVALAHAWVTAGKGDEARRVLTPALAPDRGASDRVRVQAWLMNARLSHTSGDTSRGHRSLASALRLAEAEQLRLPFAQERNWIGSVLRQKPELAEAYRGLLIPALGHEQLPAPVTASDQPAVRAVEPLSEREREVLRHVSGMLSTAEVASEMYLSVNTVKTHLRTIYRKLAATHRGEAVRRARQLELI